MNDDFEKRLQRAAPREIPSGWREKILDAAREARVADHIGRRTESGLLATWIEQVAAGLRVGRVAWAGLAAVWLVIVGLHFSGGPESSTSSAKVVVAPELTRLALKQKQLLLAELAGRVEPLESIQPRLPGPRSQRREDASVG